MRLNELQEGMPILEPGESHLRFGNVSVEVISVSGLVREIGWGGSTNNRKIARSEGMIPKIAEADEHGIIRVQIVL